MKTKNLLILLILLVSTFKTVYSQSTVLTNVRPAAPPSFVGWDGTGPNIGPLEVRNDFNRQIRFFTNTFQRMVMDNGSGVASGGRMAFGSNCLQLPIF